MGSFQSVSRGEIARMLSVVQREHPTVSESTLINGAQFVGLVFPEDTRRGFYAAVHFDAGGRREGIGEAGLTHFFEHLLPVASKSPRGDSPMTVAARKGWKIDAMTSLDDLTFSIESIDNDAADAAALLAELIAPDEDGCRRVFEQERLRIVREIEHNGGGSPRRSVRTLERAAFPKSGFGEPIMGTVEQLNQRSFADVWQYGSRLISADRATVVVSGTRAAVEAMYRTFDQAVLFIGDAPAAKPIPIERYLNWGNVPRVMKLWDIPLPDTELEAWWLATKKVGELESVALPLLNRLCSDLLFAEISEKRGLCYQTAVSPWRVQDVMFSRGTLRVPSAALEESMAALRDIRGAVVDRITPELLAAYATRTLEHVYQSRGMVNPIDYLRRVASRQAPDLDLERLTKIQRLTPMAVRNLAHKVFDPDNVRFIAF